MPMDFPTSPNYYDRFNPAGGPKYTWDNNAWKIGPIAPLPTPLLTRIAPDELVAGAVSPVTITCTGTGFLASSVIKLDDVAVPTTYVSATTLTFDYTIPAAAIVSQIKVVNPDNQETATRSLVVTLTKHELLSIAPSTVIANTPSATTVTATGNAFTGTSKVTIDNVPTTTTFVSATAVTFAYPAPAIATTVQIRVVTNGKSTNALPLSTVLQPVLTTLSPNTLNHQQTGGQSIQVTGQNFDTSGGPNATVIYEDGVAKATQVSSATGLQWSCMWPGSARTLTITARNGSVASPAGLPFTWTGS